MTSATPEHDEVQDGARVAPPPPANTSSSAADGPSGSRFGRPGGRFKQHGPWLVAVIFVLPYFLLMISWAVSNAPGAAPDEPDHLSKSLGMARYDIGTTYTGPALGSGNIPMQRNASISRVIPVPSNLAPFGFTCESFKPTVSASCLPTKFTQSTALRNVIDPLGSYPPFLYVPMGWVASLADTPSTAFVLTRLFCALGCSVLLLLGAAHLVRWLGRRALLGAFVGLTPMAVFCASIVSTSGFEICSAFAVACIVVVASRRPESLQRSGTAWLLALVGATLILSRQLGVVTFGLLMVLLVVRVGWPFFWGLIRRIRPPLAATIVILAVCTVLVAYWERKYDHPSLTGPALSSSALGAFVPKSYNTVLSAVAKFGWADTLVPSWFVGTWIVLCVMVVGIGVLIGRRADRWTLIIWVFAMVVVCYVTFATVFYTVGAGVQGRHMLAFFMLLPLLAGVVVVERLDEFDPAVIRRIFLLIAVVMPAFQWLSLYINARRYAVGTNGPIWFLGHSKWSPPGGSASWLLLGLCGAVLLARTIWWAGKPAPQLLDDKELASVER